MANKGYGVAIADQTGWRNIGKITVAGSALASTTSGQASVDAIAATTKILADLEGEPEALLIRFRTNATNNDDWVCDINFGIQNDHYFRVATLAVKACLMVSPGTASCVFGDTITPSNEVSIFDGEEVAGSDTMGLYFVRTFGFKKILVIVTTLPAGHTLYVDVKNVSI